MTQLLQRFESRQTLNRADFEIFHYKDKAPGCVELHHHDFYEVYLFLSGNVEYRVEGKSYRLQRGDLLLINPMELHQPIVLDHEIPYERIVLWVDCTYLRSCGQELLRCFDMQLPTHENLIRSKTHRTAAIMEQMDALVQEQRSTKYGSQLYAKGLLLQIMVELNRLSASAAVAAPSSQSLPVQVASYIGTHYRQPLTLDSLAEHFFVSKYHLSHTFTQAIGVSVYRYIVLKRLQASRELLLAGQSPKEAFLSSGFGDYANFYRAFQAEYGITPRMCMDSQSPGKS